VNFLTGKTWIYFIAPPLGMLAAAEWYRRQSRAPAVICAKLHHHNDKRCIFRCGYQVAQESPPKPQKRGVLRS
jgi:hypothetical protein